MDTIYMLLTNTTGKTIFEMFTFMCAYMQVIRVNYIYIDRDQRATAKAGHHHYCLPMTLNVVTLRQARLVLGWVTALWAGKPSRHITSYLGQLRRRPMTAAPRRPVGAMNNIAYSGDSSGRTHGL